MDQNKCPISHIQILSSKGCKGASTLRRTAECNTLQLCRVAKVARHMPPMQSRPHEKRIFCRPSSGYKNCGTRPVNFVWFFFFKLADTILKPLTHHMLHSFLWWDWQFIVRIFRTQNIEWHAAVEQTQHPHILAAWHDFCCATLPHCAAVYRVA